MAHSVRELMRRAPFFFFPRSICISVMDYLPITLYLQPPSLNFYWGTIDEAIRSAAFRFVSLLYEHS